MAPGEGRRPLTPEAWPPPAINTAWFWNQAIFHIGAWVQLPYNQPERRGT